MSETRATFEWFDSLLRRMQQEEIEVRSHGQKEYAHTEKNVFANFERVAEGLGLEREQVLMVHLLKHVDGIVAWVRGHRSQREDVRGRIKDARMYLALLWGMVESEEPTSSSVSVSTVGPSQEPDDTRTVTAMRFVGATIDANGNMSAAYEPLNSFDGQTEVTDDAARCEHCGVKLTLINYGGKGTRCVECGGIHNA